MADISNQTCIKLLRYSSHLDFKAILWYIAVVDVRFNIFSNLQLLLTNENQRCSDKQPALIFIDYISQWSTALILAAVTRV